MEKYSYVILLNEKQKHNWLYSFTTMGIRNVTKYKLKITNKKIMHV